MANVLMIWEQGSGLGHMTSMLPIAKSLQTKGHQVSIALKDFSKSNKVFKDEQFRFIACPAFSGRVKNHFAKSATFAHIMHNVGFGDYEVLAALVNVWRSTFELLQPELVITDHSPVAMLAARSCEIKTVTLGTGFSCPAPCYPYPDWRPEQKNCQNQLLADEKFVLKNANTLLVQAGAAPLEILSDLYRQAAPLLITYPELDPFSDRQDAQYLGVLPTIRGVEPNWPDVDEPRVFAYLRPIPGIERLLNVLTTKKISTIVRMPGAPRQLQAKYPSLIWEEEFVDLSIAASKSDFCIGHGTHMMTSRWLLSGKPVLMIPPYLEQCLTAKQVVAFGAGLTSNLMGPDHLPEAVDELLLRPERFRKAAEKFQQQHIKKSPEKALESAVKKISTILGEEPEKRIPLARMEMSKTFINNWISLRYNPHWKQFQGFVGAPFTHRLFDWVIWERDGLNATRIDNARPRSILCLAMPQSIEKLMASLDDESKPTLVIGGTDELLSNLIELLNPNLHRFKKVFFEAKDIEHDKISSFPMGFISFYLRNSGYESIKTAFELSNKTDKSQLLLAAWGKEWKVLDETIDERVSAISFLANHPLFERKMLEHEEYWLELAKHHFFLAPKGNGIQAPKLAEAWMVKTVPVVIQNPCFADLKAIGFPFVFVNQWKEVTPQLLNDWLTHNEPIDWERVRYQLTNDYLKNLITD